MGLVVGIVTMGNAVRSALQSNSNTDKLDPYLRASLAVLCIDAPSGVTNGQMVRVVVRHIEAQPARMHQAFSHLALDALRDAWPCK
jgi:hypothetical protein